MFLPVKALSAILRPWAEAIFALFSARIVNLHSLRAYPRPKFGRCRAYLELGLYRQRIG